MRWGRRREERSELYIRIERRLEKVIMDCKGRQKGYAHSRGYGRVR